MATSTRRRLPETLWDLGSKMSPQQSSKVLWALGTLGAKLGNQPEHISKEVVLLHLSRVVSRSAVRQGEECRRRRL